MRLVPGAQKPRIGSICAKRAQRLCAGYAHLRQGRFHSRPKVANGGNRRRHETTTDDTPAMGQAGKTATLTQAARLEISAKAHGPCAPFGKNQPIVARQSLDQRPILKPGNRGLCPHPGMGWLRRSTGAMGLRAIRSRMRRRFFRRIFLGCRIHGTTSEVFAHTQMKPRKYGQHWPGLRHNPGQSARALLRPDRRQA
jgi:hypothetical protein